MYSYRFSRFGIPAYYQLGVWRVQYLQKVCCVCGIHPVATMGNAKSAAIKTVNNKQDTVNNQPYTANNQQNATSDRQQGPRSERPFFSAFICQDCHQDLDWLPPVFEQLLPISPARTILSNPSDLLNHSTSQAQFQVQIMSTAKEQQPSSQPRTLSIQPAAPHVNYLRRAIIGFKYQEQLHLLPILVHAIQQLARPQGCHASNSVILATPTTRQRLAARGFEPVSILAYYLSQHWQIPIWKGVRRVDDTISQQGLDRHQRQANISEAFELIQKLPTRRVLLFDDVVTTGATLSALALTILEAYPETQILAYSLSHGH